MGEGASRWPGASARVQGASAVVHGHDPRLECEQQAEVEAVEQRDGPPQRHGSWSENVLGYT